MVRFSELETDPDLERDGVWVPYLPGVYVRVAARISHATEIDVDASRYGADGRLIAAKMVPLRPPDERCTHAQVASEVLRDWSGVVTEDGREVPFSAAAALEMLKSPHHHNLHSFVMQVASEMTNYNLRQVERQRALNARLRTAGTA